jgi:hypothetical protein
MIRVYLDLSFNSFCEVQRADVTRTAPVDGRDPNSPSMVWVGRSAHVRLVSVGRLTGPASFVTGRIRSRYYAASRPRVVGEDDTAYPWGGVCTELFDCPVPGGPASLTTGRDILSCSTNYDCC